MAISIKQTSEYKGSNRWSWSVWLEGTPEELDAVASVTYHLHPTFPEPVVTTTNRKASFRLKSSGWGEFEISAEIHLEGKAKPLKRKHWLKLAPPPARGRAKQKDASPSIFVSYSAVDAQALPALEEAVGPLDIQLLNSGSVADAGMDLDVSLERAVKNSAAFVAVISDKTSRWVEKEIELARKHKVPIVPFILGEGTQIPASIADLQAIHVKNAGDLEHAAGRLATSLEALTAPPRSKR